MSRPLYGVRPVRSEGAQASGGHTVPRAPLLHAKNLPLRAVVRAQLPVQNGVLPLAPALTNLDGKWEEERNEAYMA